MIWVDPVGHGPQDPPSSSPSAPRSPGPPPASWRWRPRGTRATGWRLHCSASPRS